jgi:hypothetical protein
MGRLLSAELYARGLDSFSRDMPSWESGREVWPPPRQSMASAFAAMMPDYDRRRFSANWANYNESCAAAQRAEQQRIADYYARTKKEQEERENAEARELFMAQQQRMIRRP